MPESRADRAIRLLREAADALDEIPVRYRAGRGLLTFNVTPTTLRAQADTIVDHLASARAMVDEIGGDVDDPAPRRAMASTAGLGASDEHRVRP